MIESKDSHRNTASLSHRKLLRSVSLSSSPSHHRTVAVDAETLSASVNQGLNYNNNNNNNDTKLNELELETEYNDGKLVPMSRVGNCYCGPKQEFHQRYNKAFASVRCVVIDKKIISGAKSITEYVEYKFRSQARYKGPKSLDSDKTFRVRAWSNPDFCGLTFHRYVTYFMYLPDPRLNSIAGNAGRDVYAADQCSKAYTWGGLSEDNKQFLRAKRRQLQ